MRYTFSLLAFILILSPCWAQTDSTYAAVVNEEFGSVRINAVDDIEYSTFQSITVNSPKGSGMAYLHFYDNQFTKMKTYDVVVRDNWNNVIATFNKKDFQAEMESNSITTYEDDLRYTLDCRHNSYPYTIEITSLKKMEFLFDLTWVFTNGSNVQTKASKFSVEFPLDFPLVYALNRGDLLKVDSLDTEETKRYDIELASSYHYISQSYQRENQFPFVTIIAESFEFGKLQGSFKTWSDYGIWYNKLWEGRNELPKSAMADIDNVIEGKQTELEKAKAIYKYVQHRMRYVYVGYGLGGLQTMEASETYKYGYGDCKGLTNFTNAAMQYAGIESYPALIAAGKSHRFIDPDRPVDFFNHVVLCLPQIGDTTWLECTSSSAPFGYTSYFTDDRYALLLKPEGGLLVRTPAFSEMDNSAIRNYRFDLESNGSANIHFAGEYHNLAMERTAFKGIEFKDAPPKETIKYELKLSAFDLENYESEYCPNDQAVLEVELDLKARNVGRRVGDRMMVLPFINNSILPELDSTDVRVIPIFFKHGYAVSDSINIALPEGMTLSDLPSEYVLDTEYGSMIIDANYDDQAGLLTLKRDILFRKGEYPASEYGAVCRFLNQVKDYNNTYFVFEKR